MKQRDRWYLSEGLPVWKYQNEDWQEKTSFYVWGVIVTTLVLGLLLFSCQYQPARADQVKQIGTASWYSVESCRREGTSGIMANGKRLNDDEYTAAMWGVPFGTRFIVTNIRNGRSVCVVISDRGPAKRLVKQGRIIDLSKAAFAAIADLRQGLIQVEVSHV